MINFYKEFRSAIIILITIFLVTILINVFMVKQLTWDIIRQQILYNLYYGVPLSLVNGWLFDFLSKLFPWNERPWTRAITGVLAAIFVTMTVLITLNVMLWVFIFGDQLDSLWLKENRTFFLIALVITSLVSISLHALAFFKEIQNQRTISTQLRQEKTASELSALRTQVDPHFLFNSFNVLSGLMDEDTEKAQRFLAGLSAIYRYVLEQRNEETCTVAEELNFAKQYLELQRMRFEDSIYLKTDISEEVLHKRIPSLTLQLLLENAIKHNGFNEQNPLHIEITQEDDQLRVSNNRKARTNLSDSNGIGLENIRVRYKLLTTQSLIIDANPHSFTVKLPLI
ncbi:MAG: histidine kinase [Saprospiraceae bacterium]|nr:histidine kinase [Saprospiraceae bacterium]